MDVENFEPPRALKKRLLFWRVHLQCCFKFDPYLLPHGLHCYNVLWISNMKHEFPTELSKTIVRYNKNLLRRKTGSLTIEQENKFVSEDRILLF